MASPGFKHILVLYNIPYFVLFYNYCNMQVNWCSLKKFGPETFNEMEYVDINILL